MSNPRLDYPHLYKKGKILKFKTLDNRNENVFTFCGGNASLSKIINHCNNLNQILGRVWLKSAKICSYFGLEKDASEPLSKNKSSWNLFQKHLSSFQRGGLGEEKILQKLNEMEKLLPKNSISKEDLSLVIKDFDEKLDEIRNDIKKVVG